MNNDECCNDECCNLIIAAKMKMWALGDGSMDSSTYSPLALNNCFVTYN